MEFDLIAKIKTPNERTIGAREFTIDAEPPIDLDDIHIVLDEAPKLGSLRDPSKVVTNAKRNNKYEVDK